MTLGTFLDAAPAGTWAILVKQSLDKLGNAPPTISGHMDACAQADRLPEDAHEVIVFT